MRLHACPRSLDFLELDAGCRIRKFFRKKDYIVSRCSPICCLLHTVCLGPRMLEMASSLLQNSGF